MTLRRGLGATYRLQLRPGWGFDAAAATVGYLARLGIQTVYLSPVAEAVPGSTHGYDGTDPTCLRQELGGVAGYRALVGACEEHGLGVCIDHVPNHLSTWAGGPWWRRMLAEGRDSEMGDVFDVDWTAATGSAGQAQVVLPVLDRRLEEAVTAGLVRLGSRDGRVVVEVGDAVDLPVAGGTARPDDDVVEVLAAQHYRLADWHDAGARNYRRFFDIDGLVGVRVEVPGVFDRTHALVVALAEQGRLSAIRVDHVDGLRDPDGYLRRLVGCTDVPVVVEKILTGGEELRGGWPVLGTTGYEVVDDVGGALVDPGGLAQLVAAARAEGDQSAAGLTVETRALVTAASFPAEVARAARSLEVPPEALAAVAARLPQYRTYLGPRAGGAGEVGGRRDAGGTDEAAEIAVWQRAAGDVVSAGAGDLAAGAWGLVAAVADPARRAGALGLQQLTGAVMAKGVEDTAWYRLAGPLAFCEVGGDPGLDRAGAVERFHERASRRAARGSGGLVPGTTHDTKRSEDVRARLYALSEVPVTFERGLEAVRRELGLPANGGSFAFETRVAVQLALAVLPPLAALGLGMAAQGGVAAQGAEPIGDAGWPEGAGLDERLGAALEKGAREAKRHSSWQRPDLAYEGRLHQLARTLLADRGAQLHRCFGPMVPDLARRGAVNSLSALVLRHASPGIPDTYQGDEAWNLSLVDPDNRRPVNHARMALALGGLPEEAEPEAVGELRKRWADGRIKLHLTAACLAARQGPAAAAFNADARYVPLEVEGRARRSILAFARTGSGSYGPWAVAVTTRRGGALPVPGDRRDEPGGAAGGTDQLSPVPLDLTPEDLPHGRSYRGTALRLPANAPGRFQDALTGCRVVAGNGTLAVDEVLQVLPVALLISEDGTG